MRPLRRVLLALLAVSLMLGLAGCNALSGSTASDLAAAQGPAALTRNNFTATLLRAQAKAGSAHIQATIKAAGQTGSIAGDVKGLGHPDTAAMNMAVDAAGQHLQMVLAAKVLYVKGVPFGTSAGKPWLKVDLSVADSSLSRIFNSANPADFTAYLKGITGFRDLGVATVDGVQTRHYALTVDARKMMAANPMLHGQSAAGLGLPSRITADFYVNADNLPVKLVVAAGNLASLEAHFSRYGEPVSVHVPPSSQVSTFSR